MEKITSKVAKAVIAETRKRLIATIKDLIGNRDLTLKEEYMFSEMVDVDCTGEYVVHHFTKKNLWATDNNDNSCGFGEDEKKEWNLLDTNVLITILRSLERKQVEDFIPDEE